MLTVEQTSLLYPNTRGNALRSTNKAVRVATHEPVLEMCIRTLGPTYAIEHGMGISSTPLFHRIFGIKIILSFENDVRWQSCRCCPQQNVTHEIIPWTSSIDLDERIVRLKIDPNYTIAIVDGPGLERPVVLNALQALHVPFIVEHDAETFQREEINTRMKTCQQNGYAAYQYVNQNPETALYISTRRLNQTPLSLIPGFVLLF